MDLFWLSYSICRRFEGKFMLVNVVYHEHRVKFTANFPSKRPNIFKSRSKTQPTEPLFFNFWIGIQIYREWKCVNIPDELAWIALQSSIHYFAATNWTYHLPMMNSTLEYLNDRWGAIDRRRKILVNEWKSSYGWWPATKFDAINDKKE